MKRPWSYQQVPPVIRSVAAAAIALAGAYYLATRLGRSVRLENWFFPDLATIWFWNLALSAACLCTGRLVVSKLLPSSDRTRLETLALAFPTGAVVFVMGTYLGGFLGLFGRPFAVVLPALMIAAGARSALADWREAREAGAGQLGLGGLPLVVSVVGLLLVGLLYLGAMSPDAINYDATWVHMVIPQDYAREGRIVSFPGDQVKNVPHLGAMLTTWSFLVPGLDLPALRWMMALGTEFTIFVWTLVGVAAAARWLAAREARGTWAALALFPGIFVYDSNIAGASDHFLALFAAPLVLVAAKLLRRFEPRVAILGGLLAGGALLSKLQALYLLVPLLIWTAMRAGLLLGRRWRGDPEAPSPRTMAESVGLVVGVALLVLAPHLVSNWVFYRNPLYPLLSDVFTGSHPTIKGAAEQVRMVLADWHYHPPVPLGERLGKAFEMAFSFSFAPHYSFVNELPMYGSTFTLSLPLLFVLKESRRLWIGALLGLGCLVMWAMSYWVDRNLQTFLPVLMAVTAAILVRAWELGRLARLGVTALVLVQIAWATPLYFSGTDRLNGAIALIRAGMDGRAREHLRGYRSQYVALGNALPKNAVVMLHNQHVMLGIDRPVILDWAGFQTIIDYRLFKTPRDLYDRLREIGVTHVVWPATTREAPTRQEEIIFHTFAHRYGRGGQQFGELTMFPMPSSPPPLEPGYQVLVVGMPVYPDGLYPIDALTYCEEFPPSMRTQGVASRTAPSAMSLIDGAKVVLIGPRASIDAAANERLNREFEQIHSPPGFRIMLRRN